MRWRDLVLLAFDTETTGLNPEDGHRVIEFGGVEFRLDPDGGIARVIRHEWLFNPGMRIPPEVTAVNHISDDDVKDAPAFAERAAEIHALLAGAVTVAHNYPFDQRFLGAEFAMLGLRWPSPVAEIDTSDLSRHFFRDARSHKLGDLAQRLEVPLLNAHRAADDAEACGRCFVAMARRFGAPEDLDPFVDWADAVGEPPPGGVLRRDEHRTVVFGTGTQAGRPVEEHPDVLHWMTFARERVDGRWGWRYAEPVRRWAERWLRIRASGRFPQGMKGFGPADWGIDPPLGAP